MKRLLLLFFLFLFFMFNLVLSCFACDYTIPKELQTQYRAEIYETIKKEIPKTKNKINKEFLNAQKSYNKFLKYKNRLKNTDNFIFLIQDYQRGIESYEIIFISKLIDITNKYKNINDKIPPTDSPGTLLDFIYPYFEANNINYSSIDELDSYTADKIKKLDSLLKNTN